ncbi:MAG TPA: GAF domain-containing protein [Candidatus Acidoferrales bacterium]|nr:GAF domain-containing protein [Candidatus Acidoferrales bacterium]
MARLPNVNDQADSTAGSDVYLDIDFLFEIGKRLSAAPLAQVLGRVVRFISDFIKCDSCFIYVLEGRDLMLKASKNPHVEALDNLTIRMGQGITGWVAQHKKPVSIPRKAYEDSRFRAFNELPEDKFEAFLSVPMVCRERLVGVINVQHKQPHIHSRRDIQLISVIGYLVGAEVELARLETENWKFSRQLQTSKAVPNVK